MESFFTRFLSHFFRGRFKRARGGSGKTKKSRNFSLKVPTRFEMKKE
jgi:hypothetical protein